MTLRVRRAASTSMLSRSSRSGGVISRSRPSPSQRVPIPMLSSTSMMRLTSSMRAMPRRVVFPLFSRLAHSSATLAFLLDRTSMLPLSCWPPLTRRCTGLCGASETICLSSDSPIRAIISRLRFCCPCSIRWIALWLVPSASASWLWVQPRCCRESRIKRPIWPR